MGDFLVDLRQALSTAAVPDTQVFEQTAVWFELTALENPFKGLRPFSEANAENFFGREMMVQELLSRLGDAYELGRFLAVVGPSGSGKSSVVKAGLIPASAPGRVARLAELVHHRHGARAAPL